jgi:hypothetical protein
MSNINKSNYNSLIKKRRSKRVLTAVGSVAAVSLAAGGLAFGLLKQPTGTSVKIYGDKQILALDGRGQSYQFKATDNYGRDIDAE